MWSKHAYQPETDPHYRLQPNSSSLVSKMIQCKSCNGYNIPGATSCRHCGSKLS
ncbi:50S ribosomal protein L40e [Candidatus Bathyarchaeota archaeon]|nr:50S ribosomal protein L40e [Candidatus Bathyarchaeota archaeon]